MQITSVQDLNFTQKAAAILVAMSKDQATKILSHFKPEDVKALIIASENMQDLSQETLVELVDEFEQECSRGNGLVDSSSTIQSLIEEALTPEQMAALQEGPEATEMALKKKSIWELLDKVDDKNMIEFLSEENRDVAGYVLTRLPAKRAAAMIGDLPTEVRPGVVAGMITTRPANAEAVESLEELLKNQFGRAISASKSSGSQRVVAGMLNELDRDLTDSLFADLEEVIKPGSLKSVKSMMFRFEDVISLDKAARSALFDQVSTEATTLALRGAQPGLIEAVLEALGQRTRRMLEAELETASSASAEDIKQAQKEIASAVLNLASAGTITIPEPEETEAAA
ncbi:MAG: FliG C-terminal domain-containing protein [Rhizobiaceae bacterium]